MRPGKFIMSSYGICEFIGIISIVWLFIGSLVIGRDLQSKSTWWKDMLIMGPLGVIIIAIGIVFLGVPNGWKK